MAGERLELTSGPIVDSSVAWDCARPATQRSKPLQYCVAGRSAHNRAWFVLTLTAIHGQADDQ
jgi:hypothetical protein